MKCSYNYFENHKVPLLKKNQYALLSLSLVQHEKKRRKEKNYNEPSSNVLRFTNTILDYFSCILCSNILRLKVFS